MNFDLIIPTYNRSRLLVECLESVFRARRPDDLQITVIIVDNNSSDNTREIVKPYLERSEIPCRYLFVQRTGKSAALNEALAQTNGELIGFIDDDEQLDASWFEVAWREMSSNPSLEYIGGPYHPNWEVPLPDSLPPASVYSAGLGIVLVSERREFNASFPGILMGGNIVIRRSTLQKVLPYPEELGKLGEKIRYGEDEAIYHRLLSIRARGECIPELIIYHWIPAERMTKRYYRNWCFGRAIGVGFQYRNRVGTEPRLLGIPKFRIDHAIWGIRVQLSTRSMQDKFLAQMDILSCLGMLYGRHFYNRFKGTQRTALERPAGALQPLTPSMAQGNHHRVSVIIPSYNCAPYLVQALDSVFEQRYSDLEVIVVDDGSTDHTPDVIQPYLDRIRYIRQENRGLPAARNAGILASTGRYIALLDADDYWTPTKLALQMPRFADGEVGIVYSDFSVKYSDGRELASYLSDRPLACEGRVLDHYIRSRFLFPSTMVIRRECFEQHGLFDEAMVACEDIELFTKMCNVWKVALVGKQLMVRREGAHNITANKDKIRRYTILAFQKFLRSTPQLNRTSRQIVCRELSVQCFDDGYVAFKANDARTARVRLFESLRYDKGNARKALPLLFICCVPTRLRNLLLKFKK